jgi:alkanesulfonate monooxygenase
MFPRFFWFLPTTGDSRSIVGGSHASTNRAIPDGFRPPSRRYLAEVARAADRLGFEGVLTPTGTWCEDAWLTSAALLAETEKLKFLVAFRPGLIPPTLAAQQTATLQRFSEGRVLLNVVSGSDDAEQRRFGDFLGHDERYARTAEFLQIVTSVWTQDSVDFSGEYYTVSDARVSAPPDPLPQIYFGGSSGAALPIAAEHADVYLTWGEPTVAATSGSAFGCTPSAATPRRRPGPSPTRCSPTSPTNRSPKPLHCTAVRNRRGSDE